MSLSKFLFSIFIASASAIMVVYFLFITILRTIVSVSFFVTSFSIGKPPYCVLKENQAAIDFVCHFVYNIWR